MSWVFSYVYDRVARGFFNVNLYCLRSVSLAGLDRMSHFYVVYKFSYYFCKTLNL